MRNFRMPWIDRNSDRRRVAAVGLAAALALGAAACGSDATPLAEDQPPLATDQPTVPPTTAPVESPPADTPTESAEPTTAPDPQSTVPAATPSDGAEPTAAPERSAAPEPGDPGADSPQAAADAAMAYLQAVDARDLASAWALLAAQSQDALGSQADFEALGSALAEGLAAYAAAPDLAVRVTPVADGIHAVTMSGTVTREGSTQLDATSMIVRPAGVSPFEGLATGDFATFAPTSGSELGSADVISPTIETGTLVTASINEDVIDLAQYVDAGDPSRYELPVAPFAPGPVTVTVVLGTPDALVAYAATYTATS